MDTRWHHPRRLVGAYQLLGLVKQTHTAIYGLQHRRQHRAVDNHSKFAEQYIWHFGDGWQYTHTTSLQDSLSSIPYVEHTYTTPGNYTATLYAIACGDTMTVTQTVVADPLTVADNPKPLVKLYPNPTGGNAFIESPTLANYHTLQVYNEAGQLVYSTTITAQATNRLEIPSSTWANGAYVLVLQGVGSLERLVLMKLE